MQTLTQTHSHTHSCRVPKPPLKVMPQIECSLVLKINQSSINRVSLLLLFTLSVCVDVCGHVCMRAV